MKCCVVFNDSMKHLIMHLDTMTLHNGIIVDSKISCCSVSPNIGLQSIKTIFWCWAV